MPMEVFMILKGLAIAVFAFGALVIFTAPVIVERFNLAEKRAVDEEMKETMTDEELDKYRRYQAILDIKVKGVMFAIPGAIFILVLFR